MDDIKNVDDLKNKIEQLANFASNGKINESDNKKAPRYDPTKKYRWEPSSQFLLSGEEFGVILNSLRTILNSPEAQKILFIERAAKIMDNSLARAIEVGVAQEEKSPPTK